MSKPPNYDCVVCGKCSQAMTAKEYWAHSCNFEEIMAEHKRLEGIVAKTTEKEDKIVQLEERLDDLRRELDDNQGEQEELRSVERSLTREIEDIETELDNLEDDE